MSLLIDEHFERAIKSFINLSKQVDDEFEKDFKELIDWRDEALTRLREHKNTKRNTQSPAVPSSNLKRKFRNGNPLIEEQEDVSVPEKKRPRSMKGGEDSKENLKPSGGGNMNHSTPNKDVIEQSTLCPEEDVSMVSAADKPRAKRNASVLAAAMNNKMLNEKLNIKKRRPDSLNMSRVQEMLLDQQPSVVLSNILKTTNTKQQKLSVASPAGKNGLVEQQDTNASVMIVESVCEEKDNQNDTTVTRSSRRGKKVTTEAAVVKSNSEDVVDGAEDTTVTAQDNDTIIMPPPSMPIIKKAGGRRGRQKKIDKDETVKSDEEMAYTSTRSLRTRSTRNNESKVADESLETSSRSTRSTRSTKSTASQDVPQPPPPTRKTRGRKGKEEPVVEVKEEPESPVKQLPKKQQHTVDSSDSDEEFEKKKVKLRPKRTRKGRKQTLPVIESGSSIENIPQEVETDTVNNKQKTTKGKQVAEVILEKVDDEPKDVPLRRTRSFNKAVEEEKVVTPQGKTAKKNGLVMEKETTEESLRKTRSSNRLAEMDEVSVTPKPQPKSYVVVNETFDASPQVNKNQKPLNETVVIEKGSGVDRGTIVLSNTPNNRQGLPGPQHSSNKKKLLNETVTLSPKKNGVAPLLLDQTVTLQKGDLIPYDPEHSLLTDDMSEAEDSPPPVQTKLIPKFISQGIKKIKEVFTESPVKARVQQFERLAESCSPVKVAPTVSVDAPTRVTRSKVRALTTVKETNKSTPDSDSGEQESTQSEAPTKKEKVLRSKLATPISAKTISQLKLPLPVPVSSKQGGSNVKLGPATQKAGVGLSAGDLLLSPRANTAGPVSQIYMSKDDAIKKREALLQAKAEEQRRKREEKCKAAALAREAQAKQKQALWEKAEREREEKLKQLQLEREEKQREEAEKKRLALERKAQENEERRKAEEAARHAKMMEQEEESRKQAALRQKQMEENEKFRKNQLAAEKKMQEMKSKSKKGSLSSTSGSGHHQQQRMLSYKKLQDLATDDESEDEKNPKGGVPAWAKRDHRYQVMRIQYYVKQSVVDKMYSTTVFNPNLIEIFPQIDRRKLARTSSAVWKTPPRFSMMPKDYQ